MLYTFWNRQGKYNPTTTSTLGFTQEQSSKDPTTCYRTSGIFCFLTLLQSFPNQFSVSNFPVGPNLPNSDQKVC